MKISVSRVLLDEAVFAASKAASVKSTIAILEGILIKAKDGEVVITGYDLEMGLEYKLKADVIESGSIVLNAKIFSDIVHKLPNDTVTISVDEKFNTKIDCAHSNYSILGISPEDFPELPRVSEERSIRIFSTIFKSMIKQTIYAVSQSETKPVHTGALIEVSKNNVKMICVDGFRLAIREEMLDLGSDNDFSFIVPGKTLSEISKLLGDNSEDFVNIKLTRKHIVFEYKEMIIISRLLEGEFINYKQVLATPVTTTVEVDVRSFLESIERAGLLINEKLKSPVKAIFEYNNIVITTKAALGNVREELPSKMEGDRVEIGFNHRYMAEALRYCENEKINIKLATPLSPIVLAPTSGNKFIFLILPVRI